MSTDDRAVRTATDTVEIQRLLPGPIDRVWQYLVDPEKRRLWLAAGELDLRPGGVAHLRFRHAELSTGHDVPDRYRPMHDGGHDNRGTVTHCEPPHRLAWTWGHAPGDMSEVDITLATEGDHVHLRLVHRRLDADTMPGVAAGWHTHLDILRARLRGETPADFWIAYVAHEAGYRTASLPRRDADPG